jgi:hypothetical protein
MTSDPDGFRRVYRGLNDEALLEMNRAELTETARLCCDEELTLRGLAHRAPATLGADHPSPEAFAPDGGDMVVAASCLVREDAKLAQALLESESIPSFKRHPVAPDAGNR